MRMEVPENLLSASRDITAQHRNEERIALLGEVAARQLTSGDPAALVAENFGLIDGPMQLDSFLKYLLSEGEDLVLMT
jgi:hypothetical protein